eukprot:145949_1
MDQNVRKTLRNAAQLHLAATSVQPQLSTAPDKDRDVASQSLTALEGVVGIMLPRVDIDTDEEDFEVAAKPSPFRRAFVSILEAAGSHPINLQTLRVFTHASACKLRERLERMEDVRWEEVDASLRQLEISTDDSWSTDHLQHVLYLQQLSLAPNQNRCVVRKIYR